jgi:cephalosporin-C deacetylase
MALFDLPLAELRAYRPERSEPADFDAFWKATLAEGRPVTAEFHPHDAALTEVDVYDTTFAGWGGHRVSGWLIVPKHAAGPVPCVVVYVGYGRGRGTPHDHLVWPAAGRAVLVVDTRGQGAVGGDHPGATGDPQGGAHPQSPGFMTDGILVVAAMVDVPFLTHFRRAVEITNNDPYQEIVRFLKTQRGSDDRVFHTLSYFDGQNFAARAACPALYSVALMDQTCPPSTVFASYNHWAHAAKSIEVYPWNGHEGGTAEHRSTQLRWLKEVSL